MALLGIAVGISAGLVANLFRLVLEGTFPFFSPGLNHDDFESLSPVWHFALPVIGCLVIGQILHIASPDLRRMGVSYVIDNVERFRTTLSVRNAAMQFLTASITLLTGGSCGREGPSIHLGATTGSVIGSSLGLPNNSNRILIAAGCAAAIAAAFNTPIAGVIFAMEAVLMEYAMSGIIPVIVAAVSGTVVTRFFYGDAPVFIIDAVTMGSLWLIPHVVLMGLIIGTLASLFVWLHRQAVGFQHLDIRVRLLITGLMTGLAALLMPEVLGTGYDTLNQALLGQSALEFLLALLAVKLVVTAIGLGLGLPGGVIGPSLVLGGLAGSIMGAFGAQLLPGNLSSTEFYVLIGMCAMMGATLQAPLAALMALLELSNTPAIILPAMLIIVVANITSSELFHTGAIFRNTLKPAGNGFSPELSRFLNRFGISSVANRRFNMLPPDADLDLIRHVIASDAEWIIINHEGDTKALITPSALATALESPEFSLEKLDAASEIIPFSHQATLLEALETLTDSKQNFGYITGRSHNLENEISGVFSQDDIIAFYKGR